MAQIWAREVCHLPHVPTDAMAVRPESVEAVQKYLTFCASLPWEIFRPYPLETDVQYIYIYIKIILIYTMIYAS